MEILKLSKRGLEDPQTQPVEEVVLRDSQTQPVENEILRDFQTQ